MFNSAMHLIPTALPAAQTAAAGGIESDSSPLFQIDTDEAEALPPTDLEPTEEGKLPLPDAEGEGAQAVEQLLWAISGEHPVICSAKGEGRMQPLPFVVPTLAENVLAAKLSQQSITTLGVVPREAPPEIKPSNGADIFRAPVEGFVDLDPVHSRSPTADDGKNAALGAVAVTMPPGDLPTFEPEAAAQDTAGLSEHKIEDGLPFAMSNSSFQVAPFVARPVAPTPIHQIDAEGPDLSSQKSLTQTATSPVTEASHEVKERPHLPANASGIGRHAAMPTERGPVQEASSSQDNQSEGAASTRPKSASKRTALIMADRGPVQEASSSQGDQTEGAASARSTAASEQSAHIIFRQAPDTPRTAQAQPDPTNKAVAKTPNGESLAVGSSSLAAIAAPSPASALPRDPEPGIALVRMHLPAPAEVTFKAAPSQPFVDETPQDDKALRSEHERDSPEPSLGKAAPSADPQTVADFDAPEPSAEPETLVTADTAPPLAEPTTIVVPETTTVPTMSTVSGPGPLSPHVQTVGTSAPLPPPVRQVAEAMLKTATDQPGRIEILLAPDSLGHVHFDMKHEAGGLAITLSAERPETLDLMRRHLPDLIADLKHAGIQTSSFSFGSWGMGAGPPPSRKTRP